MQEYIKKSDLENIIGNMVPSLSTPDGSGENDQLIFAAQEMCVDILHEVENIKPEDVAPVVHGKWIFKEKHRGGINLMTGTDAYGNEHTIKVDCRYIVSDPYCSICGQLNEAVFLNYCPNCGAKMQNEE